MLLVIILGGYKHNCEDKLKTCTAIPVDDAHPGFKKMMSYIMISFQNCKKKLIRFVSGTNDS